jgi:hypothetical protein
VSDWTQLGHGLLTGDFHAEVMQRFKFPIAVALTSLALVSAVVVGAFLALPNVVAAAPLFMVGGGPFNGGGGPFGHGGPGANLPPELQGLADLPAGERFAHFTGVQVNLKDKDGKPMAVHVTPGVASAASATSVTLNANDGTTRTFAINSATMTRSQSSVAQGDQVIVVTLNDDTTARAVIDAGKDGFGKGFPGGGPGGPWRH